MRPADEYMRDAEAAKTASFDELSRIARKRGEVLMGVQVCSRSSSIKT